MGSDWIVRKREGEMKKHRLKYKCRRKNGARMAANEAKMKKHQKHVVHDENAVLFT